MRIKDRKTRTLYYAWTNENSSDRGFTILCVWSVVRFTSSRWIEFQAHDKSYNLKIKELDL